MYSVDQIHWKTQYGQVMNTDLSHCHELARAVSWMINQKTTSTNFLSENIFFNGAGELRSLVPLSSNEPYNINILINFLLKASSQRALIFRKLMDVSQLRAAPVVLFYKAIVQEHLICSSPPAIISDRASVVDITDPQVIDHAKNMIQCLQGLTERLFQILAGSLKESATKEELRIQIKQALIDFQAEFHGPATDWEGCDNGVLLAYVKNKCAQSLAQEEPLHNLVFSF